MARQHYSPHFINAGAQSIESVSNLLKDMQLESGAPTLMPRPFHEDPVSHHHTMSTQPWIQMLALPPASFVTLIS